MPVPRTAMFEGTDGRPLASSAQIDRYSVAQGGSDPPVELCEIDPMPGAPGAGGAELVHRKLAGNQAWQACWLPSERVLYS
jgi:hypothetical protein